MANVFRDLLIACDVIRSVDEIDTAAGGETCSFLRSRAYSLRGKRLIAEMSTDLITVKSF